ncbi:MAG: hypothetical protein WAL71_19800 [Terriglobales bacterium]|jgi:pimeloyl-ACP methyl ester carboxylesterase
MSTTFEQWLEFVFNNPVRRRQWYWDEDLESRWEALELSDALIVQYMTRLFLEPGVLKSYSLDQVNQGLWFLVGESSPWCPSKTLLLREAALLDRVACIYAMSSFFRNFILAVTPGHFEPNGPTIGVDGVAYMWWDIFPMQFYLRSHVPGPTRPAALLSIVEEWKLGLELRDAVLKEMAEELELEIEPEIHQATLTVMSEVLDLPSELCQFSALHGLGHWHAEHPEQVEQIVDAFLARHKALRPHLIEYASRARLGDVL